MPTFLAFAGLPLPRKELLFDNIDDPFQRKDLETEPGNTELIARFRKMLKDKMTSLNDTFPASSWYRENWIENRIIKRSAAGAFPVSPGA